MPLRARLDNNNFWAKNLTEDDRGKDFKCPICSADFIVVLPKKDIIKHFRHVSGREHWEAETPEHLEMKQRIYDEAKLLGWDTELEYKIGDSPFFSEFFADVFLEKDSLKVAVECQCSPLSVKKYAMKNIGYIANGIKPLWFFGGHFWKHRWKFSLHERVNREAYKIQRILKVEDKVLDTASLYHYGQGRIWETEFKFRWKSETLGWYKSKQIDLKKILDDLIGSAKKAGKSFITFLEKLNAYEALQDVCKYSMFDSHQDLCCIANLEAPTYCTPTNCKFLRGLFNGDT